MTTGKDTASFFENGTTTQFDFCYNLYPEVLKLKAEKRCKKPQELIRLDNWYQNELPKRIKARGKDAHMEYDELVQTMKWKQSRGKFFPQLSYLVKVNTPRAVVQETKKAFRKLPNLEQAITALSNLKGVGTTMASALLAAAAPHSAPFMADECLMAIPEIEGIDYTTKEYLNFVQHIQATVNRLNTEAGGDTPFWSPHRVELALWAHYVANDLSPELLEKLPGPGASGAANTNGSAKSAVKLLGDGSEDTNDADDESLGTAAGRGDVVNNIGTESEIENENTNSTPMLTAVSAGVLQDGDSNFVSNDSTSQEPIIDENTTQTTTTTSTDEAGVGTPLASDSESNLEAPHKLNAAVAVATSGNNLHANLSAVAKAVEEAASDNAGVDTPILPTNNGNSKSNSKLHGTNASAAKTVSVLGNGNGSLLVSDSLDGENSSCLRSSANEDEDASEEEEDERVAGDEQESSSNNSSSQHEHKLLMSSNNSLLNDGTNYTANTDNDSTLSSATTGGITQKRSLHCGDFIEDANSQPELKKIRSD